MYSQFRNSEPKAVLNELLNSLNILVSYIYYSGVFLIDAKESNSLFTTGIHLLRDILITPYIGQINEDIWRIINNLPPNAGPEAIENGLRNARAMVSILKACGYKKIYICKNQSRFEFSAGSEEENAFFHSKFEQFYMKQLKQVLKKHKHVSPLTPLKEELLQQRQVIDYVSPSSKRVIIDSVEILSIKEILLTVTEDNMEDIVDLFAVIEDNGTSLKPFHLLANVFSQHLLA